MNHGRTTSRALVWVMAFLVSLPGMPGHGCLCAAQSQPALGSQTTSAEQPECCCSHQRKTPPPEPAATHRCCEAAESEEASPCCGCGAACQCKQGGPSQQPEQVPPENRGQSFDQMHQALGTFFLQHGGQEAIAPDGCDAAGLSASDRCILLCRFLL